MPPHTYFRYGRLLHPRYQPRLVYIFRPTVHITNLHAEQEFQSALSHEMSHHPPTVYQGLKLQSFWSLPTEMHLEIFRHLGFYDLYAVHLACHYFHSILPPLEQKHVFNYDELDDADASFFSRINKLAACCACQRLRPKLKKFYTWNFIGDRTGKNKLCMDCQPKGGNIAWYGTDYYDSDGNEV